MIKAILGSDNAERVLIFIQARKEGYPTEIAHFFDIPLYGIQKQVDRLEAGSILLNRKVGRTRVYSLNPRYPMINELKSLLDKTLEYYPEEIKSRLLMNRRRPRRREKPL